MFDQMRRIEALDAKRELFERIKDELDFHCHLEETILYPALNGAEFRDLLEEFYDEHQEITDILEEIDESDDEEAAMFEDDMDELMDCVEFHISREESELFAEVLRVLDGPRLAQLAAALEDSREKLAVA
ncbi:MAG: hypothetical protein A2Z97_04055 [Bdellovibrionales bacterium GWB1_52_6]|nr:MAG: hypothetical protein A2Z97_04055 [Bdellovibrionales bacterium GWB1_52_6]